MPKYAEEILAAVTELQQYPKAEQVFLEMKREHPSIALGTVYLPPCREQEKTILWRRSIMNANVSLLLNEQINKEFYSAYLYLDFANYYAAVGLDGFENWYRVQAQEERDHAMLFYQYLQNNGEDVTFEAIAKPEWERGDHMAPLKKSPGTRDAGHRQHQCHLRRRIRGQGLPHHADAGLVHQGTGRGGEERR